MGERCERCNRQLKDPESRGRGFGPVCWCKHVAEKEAHKDQTRLFNEPQLPFHGDVVLRRGDGGEVMTNVPHRIVEHSPDGFEWGYAGSGPAELALNILAMFSDERTARELHQVFKFDCITTMPRSGGEIKGSAIRRWLHKHRREAS